MANRRAWGPECLADGARTWSRIRVEWQKDPASAATLALLADGILVRWIVTLDNAATRDDVVIELRDVSHDRPDG